MKNTPIPLSTRASIVTGARAPPPPTKGVIAEASRPVRSDTRPTTSRDRWSPGDRPISQSLSPNPGIDLPPGSRDAEDRRRAREDQQDRDEGQDQEEQPREDVQFLEVHRRPEQSDDEEEHSYV